MAASSSVDHSLPPIQQTSESRSPSSSLSNKWVVEVLAALPQVGITVLPCEHAIPLAHIFSEIQRRIGFLSATQSFKRQVEELSPAQRQALNQAINGCMNQSILCYCQQPITDMRLIVPKHLTDEASEHHPAVRMERARLQKENRPELEEPDALVRTSPIDEIALAKAVMLLGQLKKLIDHFNGTSKMSEQELQDSLKYVYDRAIKPHVELSSSTASSSSTHVPDPSLALVDDVEIQVVVEPNEPVVENLQNVPVAPRAIAQDLFDVENHCLQLGDVLTCNLYPLCEPDIRTRLGVYLSLGFIALMFAGFVFLAWTAPTTEDVASSMNSTLAEKTI